MTAHADDIAALRRLLEGVEGFAGKMGWRFRASAGISGGMYQTASGEWVRKDATNGTEQDIALAVGVAMEMLRERLGMSIVQALQAIQKRVVINAVLERSGRLLPLLADVLCEPAGREGV